MKEFWSYDLDGILKRLKTNKSGLSSKEAEERIDKYGQNIFEEKKSSSNLSIFINNHATYFIRMSKFLYSISIKIKHVIYRLLLEKLFLIYSNSYTIIAILKFQLILLKFLKY